MFVVSTNHIKTFLEKTLTKQFLHKLIHFKIDRYFSIIESLSTVHSPNTSQSLQIPLMAWQILNTSLVDMKQLSVKKVFE